MKFTLISAAVAAVSSVASAAGHVKIHSNCTFPVFVQSIQYNTQKEGKFTVLHHKDDYIEDYREFGAHILMSKKRDLTPHLFVGYTNQEKAPGQKGEIFYELNAQEGNPFIKFHNRLTPSKPECQRFNCMSGDTGCYSYQSSKVYECDKPVSLDVILCQSDKA